MTMLEAILRLRPDVIGNSDSIIRESFATDENLLELCSILVLLNLRGISVPEVLTSGDHAKIASWREKQSHELTQRVRPDLLRRN